MIDKLSVCNIALVKLGQASIDSLDANSSRLADKINIIYDDVLNGILSRHNWTSFTVEAELTNKDSNDVFELPADMVRLVATNTQNYTKLAGGLKSGQDKLKILYITNDDTKVNHIGQDFLTALQWGIAQALEPLIANSTQMAGQVDALFERYLSIAINNDSSQQAMQYTDCGDIVRAVSSSAWDVGMYHLENWAGWYYV